MEQARVRVLNDCLSGDAPWLKWHKECLLPEAARVTGKLVSSVTPSYNQGQYVEDCIRSVRGHDYPSIEHIIIDGGSTDGTRNVIRKHQSSLGYWESERDGRSSNAINKGWHKSKGELL